MKSQIILSLILLLSFTTQAQEFKNLQAKNAVDRYKAELKKAEDIKEAAETRYQK